MTGHWTHKPIGDVFRVVNGGTPKTGVAEYWGGQHQWITPAEMGGLSSPYVSESHRTLTDQGLRVGAELVPPQSIILSSRAPIGHLVINEVPMAFNQGCKGLVPSKEIETKFAYYFLLANIPVLQRLGTGATFKELSGGKLKEVIFSFPDKPEQRRIVSILEESFDAIATAKANTDKNLRNARELFNSHLQTVFVQKAVEWSTTTVRQLVHDGVLKKPQDGNHGEIHPTRADYVDAGVPFIMAADLVNGKVDTQNCRFIADTTARGLRIGFSKTGDVLLSHKGTIGRVAILESSDEYVVLTPQVTYYRVVDESRLFNGFLYYCLRSPGFQAEMNRIAGAGSTRAYIGITRQLDLQIALPKIDVQHELVAQLKQSEDVSRALENNYGRKLAALDELKKSLLHQAFTGKLTAKSTDKQLESVA